MADLQDSEAQSVLDYLGRSQPISGPKLALTGGGLGGAVSAPLTPTTPTAANTGATAGGRLTGGQADLGGGRDFVSPALKLAQQLLRGAIPEGDPTRGETGRVSLSDELRSSGLGLGSTRGAPWAPGNEPIAETADRLLGPGASPEQIASLAEGPIGGAGPEIEAGAEGLTAGAEAFSLLGPEAAGATVSQLALGVLGPGAIPPFSIALSGLLTGAGPESGKMHETGTIRSDFSKAWPVLSGAGGTFERFGGLQGLPRDEQIKQLQGIAQEGGLQFDQIPAISQFTSTQGGRHAAMHPSYFSGGVGKVEPIDVSAVEKQTPQLYMDAALNSVLANDMLASLGVPFPSDTTGTTYRNLAQENPMGLLDLLSQQAGVDLRQRGQDPNDPTGTTPAQGFIDLQPGEVEGVQTPGQTMATVAKIFSRLNPDLASTPLGQIFATMGLIPSGAAPSAPASAPAPATAPTTPGGEADATMTGLGGGPAGALGFANQLLQEP